jgi:sarcosine oxidase
MVQRAYALWAELEHDAGRRLLWPTGGLVIGPRDGVLVRGALASAEAHGVPTQALSAAQVRARYPFHPADHLVGVLEARAGVLRPEACIEAMLAEAGRAGAEFRFDEPALEWSAGGHGVQVRTAAGRFEGGALVLAAGAWMAGDVSRARLPLTVARQTMFWLTPRDGTDGLDPTRWPIWLWETGEGPVYYGFPDLGEGPKVARHHGGEQVTPEDVRRAVAPEEAEELLAFFRECIPVLAGSVRDAQVCLYTNTPDEHFLIDRHPDAPAVVLVSPCSGHGFKFAPALGEAIADLATGGTPALDLRPFLLDRFQEARR